MPSLVERPRRFLGFLLALFILFHLYRISAPPNGYHAWRESDTAAVILNYYQEDSSFLQPRVNQRGATSGITGMELPVYNYTAAVLYSLFGPSHAVPRAVTLLCACAALLLLYGVTRIISGEQAAMFSTWCMAFSPLFFFYSYKIMPDLMMLVFLLAAVFLYLRFNQTNDLACWLGSAICLAISACIKPLGLSVYLLFVFLWWRNRPRSITQAFLLVGYILTTSFLTAAWFMYAQWVNAVHQTGAYYLGENLPNFHQFLFTARFFKKLFLQWPFELWVGWTMIPACIYGIYLTRKGKNAAVYFIWILSAYIVFAMTGQHSASHDYYTLVVVPPLAALTGLGLSKLWYNGKWQRALAVLLLVLAPVGACVRIASRFAETDQFDIIRQETEAAIDRESLVMVEDRTTAIKLYEMNRHGWPLRFRITHDLVSKYIRQGADFLVLERPLENYDDSLRLLVQQNPLRVGKLYAYPVQEFR